jgi:hypothetical protein
MKWINMYDSSISTIDIEQLRLPIGRYMIRGNGVFEDVDEPVQYLDVDFSIPDNVDVIIKRCHCYKLDIFPDGSFVADIEVIDNNPLLIGIIVTGLITIVTGIVGSIFIQNVDKASIGIVNIAQWAAIIGGLVVIAKVLNIIR